MAVWTHRVWGVVAAVGLAGCPGEGGGTGETGTGDSDATTASSATTGPGGPTTGPDGDPTGDPTGDPSGDPTGDPTGDPSGDPSSDPSGDPSGPTEATSDTTAGETGPGETDTGGEVATLQVQLLPQGGAVGVLRVNFAVPLRAGQLTDEAAITVRHEGTEIAAALRGLARHPDGSWRSVQVQVDVDVGEETFLEVEVGTSPTVAGLAMVPVADTLVDDATGPQVWALLPAEWLSASGVVGPIGTEAAAAGPGAAWATLCDYEAWGVDAFVAAMNAADVWLYDRGTIFYRGHARRGDLGTLRSAYLEATIYRNGLSGSGADTEIGVPGKVGDAKYYYAQNMALHYLMTGDDRFRESAEDVAEAYAGLWADPGYAGGDDFWTERHAGFGLLAYVWAMIVSDDQADQFRGLADEAVTAYIAVQETYPLGYDDTEARCFAHSDVAAGEDFGFEGCSPWLSAILADGLDQYATEVGGAEADAARTSIVKLGRAVALHGLDDAGKPYYWMGIGDGNGAVDDYEEHWGESAYVVALAYFHDGGTDAALAATAAGLVEGFAVFAEVPHLRSFNWQCRSAVATPWLLGP